MASEISLKREALRTALLDAMARAMDGDASTLTLRQFNLLLRIHSPFEPMSPIELCRATGLSRSAVARAIDRLERGQFVSRKQSDPKRQRSIKISIEHKGAEVAREFYRAILMRLEKVEPGAGG